MKKLGITIKEIGYNTWILETAEGNSVRPSPIQFLPLLAELNVDPIEALEAIGSLEENGHNLIEIGRFGSVLFTKYVGVVQ